MGIRKEPWLSFVFTATHIKAAGTTRFTFFGHTTALDMRSNALSLGNTREKVKVPL